MGAIQDILNKFGNETVKIIRDNLSATGTNASGETSQSLQSVLIGQDRVQVIGKPFIYVVETGRKAGKRPPIEGILKWIGTGKPSFEGSALSFAWAISTKIGKLGSSLFRRGGRNDIITPAISEERVDSLTSEIADVSLDLVVKTIEDGTKR